jgi:hypothetical protein
VARHVRWAALALFVAGVSCGASAGNPTTSAELYTVTTTVMQKPGEAPHACNGVPLPYPPIGCGGPDVLGLDLATMRGATRYVNGVRETGMLRLVGTWNGRALVLTQPPTTASLTSGTVTHTCDQPYGFTSEGTPPMMQRLLSDTRLLADRGIQLLQFGPCSESTYFVVVPVADADTVNYMAARYGPTLKVYGWFEPIS